jgi:hypothetical protein
VLKTIEAAERGHEPASGQLKDLVEKAFFLLERAAREIPESGNPGDQEGS